MKGVSECYECVPHPPAKGFPICTIRNTPDKPIHCIVWAKDLLFQRMFGPPDAISDLDERGGGDTDFGEAHDAGVTPRPHACTLALPACASFFVIPHPLDFLCFGHFPSKRWVQLLLPPESHLCVCHGYQIGLPLRLTRTPTGSATA
jgi:hypothetical protein